MDTGQVTTRYLPRGGSYLSASDKRIQVYWPDELVASTAAESTAAEAAGRWVQVTWPSSQVEYYRLTMGCENVLVQGMGQATY